MWGDLEARIKSWVARSRCAIRGVSGLLRRSFRAFSFFLLSTLSAIIVHIKTGCQTPLSLPLVRTETGGGPSARSRSNSGPPVPAGAGPAGGALAPGFGFGPNRSREAVALCLPALPLPSSLTPSHPEAGRNRSPVRKIPAGGQGTVAPHFNHGILLASRIGSVQGPTWGLPGRDADPTDALGHRLRCRAAIPGANRPLAERSPAVRTGP